MSLEEHSPELSLAVQAAQKAGDILLDYLERENIIQEKGESNFVSEADLKSEAMILSMIRDVFPGHVILAEESFTELSGTELPEHLWVVDPLDGTTNYTHGIPHFAVSIAYIRNGRTQCGVVFNPARYDWYVAARGAGAWYNDTRLIVGQQSSLSDCLVGLGFYYDRGEMMEATLATIHKLFKTGIHGVRRFGTASLDLAQVARGMYGAYFEYQLAPWDFAAGRLLVEEAGGRCTTATGAELPLAHTSLLATNTLLHPTMLEIIRETAGHLFQKK